jgi:hypothetical protein
MTPESVLRAGLASGAGKGKRLAAATPAFTVGRDGWATAIGGDDGGCSGKERQREQYDCNPTHGYLLSG